MNYIGSENDLNEVTKEGVTIVDFYADWCGPCRMLAPILEDLSQEVETPIYKVDVDECENLSRKFGILSIPTMIFFKNGKQVEKITGLKSKQEIKQILEGFLNN